MSKNKKIILTAVLLAMQIVLSRFLSIKTPILKISFAFIPSMFCAIWLGAKWTVLLNVLGDIIGATLFPIGAFFIGYTISTAISGLIYGLLLYKKEDNSYTDKQFIIRLIISVILVTCISNVGLNTLWISITTGKAFIVLLGARIVKELIMIPIQIVVIVFIKKTLRKPFNTYIRSSND
ncbi:MAG: folate family ECF transporter S component [Clostridia bacterium]|nr:folate family ECF transporter S component [Clostridia bacterium]